MFPVAIGIPGIAIEYKYPINMMPLYDRYHY